MAPRQKLNLEFLYDPATEPRGLDQKELNKTGTRRDTCAPVFTAASLTMSQRWKQLKHPWMDACIAHCGPHTHGVFFSPAEEGNSGICHSMDNPGRHYAKQNKPGTKGRTYSPYMRYLEKPNAQTGRRTVAIRAEEEGLGVSV